MNITSIYVLVNKSDEYANMNGLKFRVSKIIKFHCQVGPRTEKCLRSVSDTEKLRLNELKILNNRSVRSACSHKQHCNYFFSSTNRICPKGEYGDGNMNAIIDQ